MSTELATGYVRGVHGVRGYLTISSYSGEFDHLRSLKTVVLVKDRRREEMRIEDIRVTAKGALLKVENVDDPETGRKYTGWELWVRRKIAAPLVKGEYYVADLVGCNMILEEKCIGTVLHVCDGTDSLLEVLLEDDRTVYVPFRNEFIGKVDLKARSIEVLVDWFFK